MPENGLAANTPRKRSVVSSAKLLHIESFTNSESWGFMFSQALERCFINSRAFVRPELNYLLVISMKGFQRIFRIISNVF